MIRPAFRLAVTAYRAPGSSPIGAPGGGPILGAIRLRSGDDPAGALRQAGLLLAETPAGRIRIYFEPAVDEAYLWLELRAPGEAIAQLEKGDLPPDRRAPLVAWLGQAEAAPPQPDAPGAVSAAAPAPDPVSGLIWILEALHGGVLKATPGCRVAAGGSVPLPVDIALPWYAAGPRRIGELRSGGAPIVVRRHRPPDLRPGAAALVQLSAPDARALGHQVAALRRAAQRGAPVHMLAAEARILAEPGPVRLAAVAGTPTELIAHLDRLSAALGSGGRQRLADPRGAWLGLAPPHPPRTAFLFPGHGSQYPGMLREQECHIPAVRRWFEALESHVGAGGILPCPLRHLPPEDLPEEHAERLRALEGGGVAALTGSLGLYEAARAAGVPADVLCGYSLGEQTALVAAGVALYPSRDAFFIQVAETCRAGAGGLERGEIPLGVSVGVSVVDRAALMAAVARHPDVHVATDDSPSHLTLFGAPGAMRALGPVLAAAGVQISALPNDRSYHTPAFSPEMPSVREALERMPVGRARLPVLSCCSLEIFPDDPAEVRDLAARQFAEPVRFREALERLYADGVRIFVEAGPRGQLAAYARQTFIGRKAVIVELDRQDGAGWRQVLRALGRLHVAGVNVDSGHWHARA